MQANLRRLLRANSGVKGKMSWAMPSDLLFNKHMGILHISRVIVGVVHNYIQAKQGSWQQMAGINLYSCMEAWGRC